MLSLSPVIFVVGLQQMLLHEHHHWDGTKGGSHSNSGGSTGVFAAKPRGHLIQDRNIGLKASYSGQNQMLQVMVDFLLHRKCLELKNGHVLLNK